MQFTLLYRYDPTTASPAEAEIPDWMTFDAQAREAGVYVFDAAFHGVDAARSVSTKDGTVAGVSTPTDVVAGFYVLDVADADAAADWASRIPTAGYGTVEVREVIDFG